MTKKKKRRRMIRPAIVHWRAKGFEMEAAQFGDEADGT
jgi:hypothetical protein